MGDRLVIGLNSDLSVKKLKGDSRPLIPENERREMLLALKSVDYVIIFDEETPLRLIQQVRPNVLVKGGDWPIHTIVGNEFVTASGGEVRCLSYIEGHSTTKIIAKLAADLNSSPE